MKCVPSLFLSYLLVSPIANLRNSSKPTLEKSEMPKSSLIVFLVDPKGARYVILKVLFLTSFNSVGYVEFKELESVNKALALTGTKLLGIPIVVQYTEAERNRQAQNNAPAAENANIVMYASTMLSPSL